MGCLELVPQKHQVLKWRKLLYKEGKSCIQAKCKVTVHFFFYYFIWGREREWGEQGREGDRESKADFKLSIEPDEGLSPWPQNHDPSRNQQLDAQLTEPPRHPYMIGFYGSNDAELKSWGFAQTAHA